MKELKVRQVIISKQGEFSENYQKFKDIVKQKKISVKIVEKNDKIIIEMIYILISYGLIMKNSFQKIY